MHMCLITLQNSAPLPQNRLKQRHTSEGNGKLTRRERDRETGRQTGQTDWGGGGRERLGELYYVRIEV